MIHALRKLVRSIHRRSVWQVLVLYLLGSWLVVVAVRGVTAVSGLPAWTSTMTLVLLLAMLPLVVATAVVQGGLPGLRLEDEVDPNELVGLTPEQVHVIPEAHPLHGSGIFTWKNMVLGGVTSAALLVTSVVAYMTMWAFGIGPVGSLLAQGVIEERALVALSGFTNHTDDASIADLAMDVFDLELSRSGVVTLATMGREDARLTVSAEAARRDAGYLVSSSVALPSGSVIARFEERSAGDEDLLLALERLTARVRERMGESLRAIREGERLAPIVTESSEALRLYRESARAHGGGDLAEAIRLLNESVRVDPSFVMAWRRLGLLAEEAGDQRVARSAYQRIVDLWAPTGVAERTVEQMRVRIANLE